MSSKEKLLENIEKNRRKRIETERQENKDKTKPQVIEDINTKREAGIITDEVADKYIGIVEDMFVKAEIWKNSNPNSVPVRAEERKEYPDMTISVAMSSLWRKFVSDSYKKESSCSPYEPLQVAIQKRAIWNWVKTYSSIEGGKVNTLQSVVGYDVIADSMQDISIGKIKLNYDEKIYGKHANRLVKRYLDCSGIDSSKYIVSNDSTLQNDKHEKEIEKE
ncbi:MAG: hypothetical protein E7361_03760 [Clostridiales bacterium]|nr:hypothetical protein [Clostridiales bacterium]